MGFYPVSTPPLLPQLRPNVLSCNDEKHVSMLNSIYVMINGWYDFSNSEKWNAKNYYQSVHMQTCTPPNRISFFVSGNFNTESDNNDETDFCRRYN